MKAQYDNVQIRQLSAEQHPCAANWDYVANAESHYKKLIMVQRHKCVGSFCLRRKCRPNGDEYGEPVCRFGYPLDIQAVSSITFNELGNGSVRANFISKRNDPRLNQHCKMDLQAWMANCDMQIVLDEEQAIRYHVKYASKPEKRSSNINNLLRSLLPRQNLTEQSSIAESLVEDNETARHSVEGPSLIRRLAIRAVGERDRSQQEIMHLLMQETLCHSDFVYVNLPLDKFDFRT